MPTRILRLAEVVRNTGLPRSSLYAKVSEGTFPAPVKLGARSVGWSSEEIESWINARIAESRGSKV
jgi:prophage regulatory protein